MTNFENQELSTGAETSKEIVEKIDKLAAQIIELLGSHLLVKTEIVSGNPVNFIIKTYDVSGQIVALRQRDPEVELSVPDQIMIRFPQVVLMVTQINDGQLRLNECRSLDTELQERVYGSDFMDNPFVFTRSVAIKVNREDDAYVSVPQHNEQPNTQILAILEDIIASLTQKQEIPVQGDEEKVSDSFLRINSPDPDSLEAAVALPEPDTQQEKQTIVRKAQKEQRAQKK